MQKEMANIRKHAGEFLRRFENHDYEATASGIYFPRSHVMAGGVYSVQLPDGTWEDSSNLVTLQGREYLLKVALAGQAAQAGWYLTLFGNDYTPVDGVTAASFPVAAGELTSTTEGFSNATRPAWQAGPVVAASMDNHNSPATFTMKTASVIGVYGAALLSEQARGSVGGVLLSVAKFRVKKEFENDEEMKLRYRTFIIPQ